MSAATAPSGTSDHAAWAQAVRRRQVEVLEDLAQSGLRLARGIESQALEAEAPAEAAMAFGRVARAVRMACLLQSRLVKDMDEALSRQAFEKQREARRADEAREAVKDRVHAIVGRVAWAQDGADEDRVERVTDEASERLETDDIYGDVLARPMADLVADICRDLGLEPDWERLGQEAWMSSATSPIAEAMAGGGPLAEERMVEGAGGIYPLKTSPPETGESGPPPPPSALRPMVPLPPFAAANGGGQRATSPPS